MPMFYYDVLVRTGRPNNQLFTYKSADRHHLNQVVTVPFAGRDHRGLIIYSSKHPGKSVTVKKIKAAGPVLPQPFVNAIDRFSVQDGLSNNERAQMLLSNSNSRKLKPEPKSAAGQRPTSLNRDQRSIYDQIKTAGPGQPQLLAGITGSGKTRLYIKLIKDCFKKGLWGLVLVPEIGLSQQTLAQIREHLDGPVYHFHSRLSRPQKEKIWRRCQQGDGPGIVVGPRSAALLPITSLGIIIIDECHDPSFKQSGRAAYQSLHLASCLARSHGAYLIAASATPNVTDYYHFQKKSYPIHHLNRRARPGKPARILIVDQPSGKNVLTEAAKASLMRALAANNQGLVFLNRRGTYQLIRCWQCSWEAVCPKEHGRLICHDDQFQLRCRDCRWQQTPPSACPQCQEPIYYGQPGTKLLINDLKRIAGLFEPPAGLNRFDSDNQTSRSLANRLDQIRSEPRQLIVGTKIIAKGLNWTNLETVVIVSPEIDLIDADYRVSERFFQQIVHLIGRVGRGYVDNTEVIIQSRQPTNPILIAAVANKWADFYKQEIKQRRLANLPPFRHSANIYVSRPDQERGLAAAKRLRTHLTAKLPDVHFHKPLPGLRRSPETVWIINAFSKRRASLVAIKRHCRLPTARVDLDPEDLFRTPH